MVSALILVLRQLVTGLALAASAGVIGRSILALLHATRGAADPAVPGGHRGLALSGRLETAAISTTLGLGALALFGWLLGSLGLLRPLPLLIGLGMLLALSGAGWRSLWQDLGEAGAWLRRLSKVEPQQRPRALAGVAGVMAGAALLLPMALLTLYPPTAFDATLYHLPYARALPTAGAIPFLAWSRIPIFPQFVETLFALLLPFGGDLSTQMVPLLATLLTLALLWVWARQFSPAAGWMAMAAYAGHPLVIYLATVPYVESCLALFAALALYAAYRWQQGAGGGWLTVAALAAGAAADIKYLGVLVLLWLAVLTLATRPPGQHSRWHSLAYVVALGGLVMVPWYGRILLATGNPVFPFLPSIFGSTPWDPGELRAAGRLGTRVADVALELLRLPWDAVFERQRLGGNPPFSPLFLMAAPFLVLACIGRRQVRLPVVAAALYTAIVLATLPNARYLAAALPALSLASGVGLALACNGLPVERRQGAAVALAVLIALPGCGYAWYHVHRLGPVPATSGERETYLRRSLPGYSAVRFLNQRCGDQFTVYALHAENLRDFSQGAFLGDWTGPGAYGRVLPARADAGVLYGRLQHLGADYLLTLDGDPALSQYPAAQFGRFFYPIFGDDRARLYALRDGVVTAAHASATGGTGGASEALEGASGLH